MSTINDILTLDLQADIKNVIDLEDRSENEIQKEIESYIVTDGIGKHLSSFTNDFTSNISETGVWLSGFYGSGKSYFGKMLGYIIDNPVINGTPARDRFILRLKGVKDEALTETAIRNLDRINSRVVFLDVAKQNTDNGLAFTLFNNLLKSLGYRDDLYGWMEFDLSLDGKLDEFKKIVLQKEGKEWDTLKRNNRLVAKIMRSTHMEMGFSETAYDDTKKVYEDAVNTFAADKLGEHLKRYLKSNPDETIVFVFDEASEAISQDKFSLLDLEGVSEALSSLGGKAWTIAIAQEKLDDVINNANVNRSQLTKVTDRFKTKIHLDSTEVDVIIRSRLLQKTEAAQQQLIDYYHDKEGQVSDATNLKAAVSTKTADAEEFAICYPFHNYQFNILQKFLFSSNALAQTQIAARGMIITTFDVLRKQMKEKSLFAFTTAHDICTEAETAPPVDLVNKYDTARQILNNTDSDIKGELLLKTIHLLSDSELVSPTVENITKSYISDITTYYEIKPQIEKSLNLLVEEKVLLLSNNNYKITSDLEGKLLDEMKDLDVELYTKKRELITSLKEYKLFNPLASYSDGGESFKFSIKSDLDDELSPTGNKHLNIKAYSLFNISEDRQDFIASVKMETQSTKDTITLIPDNSEFNASDKLLGEVTRYTYMEEKYASEPDQNKRQIIRDFAAIREEKEKDLRNKIESAYHKSSLIYLFDEHTLDPSSFQSATTDIQKKLIKNIFTKRLPTQLSETIAPKVFTARKEGLARLFSGNDFQFFDGSGNFTGDHLKVVDEINVKIRNRYTDGKSLETELSNAPWGYSYGTIVSTLAALFRAGRVSVKYNGESFFSHDDKTVLAAFSNSTKFRAAAFKYIAASLTTTQKSDSVNVLIDLSIKDHTGTKVDWNTNDFDLAEAISKLAEHFLSALKGLHDSVENFDSLFPTLIAEKQVLQAFSGQVTESNYIEKVEYLLAHKDQYKSSIASIINAQKFIKKNFSKVKEFKRFITDVVAELKKSDRSSADIQDASDEFTRLYTHDMVKNLGALQQQAQEIKDSYFKLTKNAAEGMNQKHQQLHASVDKALRDLEGNYPPEPNKLNLCKIKNLQKYCQDRIIDDLSLNYSISCEHCGFSLSDIQNYTALVPTKETELQILIAGFISATTPPPGGPAGGPDPKVAPTPAPRPPRKVILHVSKSVMSVQDYKALLTTQLTSLANANPNETIELEVEI